MNNNLYNIKIIFLFVIFIYIDHKHVQYVIRFYGKNEMMRNELDLVVEVQKKIERNLLSLRLN